jgi:hypothetical protein
MVAASSAPVPAPAPPAPVAPAIPPGDKDALFQALIARLPPTQRIMLAEGRAISLTDRRLTIGVPAEHFGLLDPRRDEPALTAKLSELGVGDLGVSLVALDPPAPTPPAAGAIPASTPSQPSRPVAAPPKPVETKPAKVVPLQLNREDFLTDPLIQQALDVFKGQLVEVRAPGVES